tara:strand:+ start:3904 stop:4035 length:132 start_codon:yes stop_codon:yes gene_type:complete
LSLLLPFLKPKWINVFKKYFGIKYFKGIGTPFNSNLEILTAEL